jgi:endonuclease/exonuclease/phosphatase (EEP) superfamily protein YafD
MDGSGTEGKSGRTRMSDASTGRNRDGNSHPISRWSRRFSAMTWAITLGLLIVAILRVVCPDIWDLFIWFNAFTLYFYLPAYVVAATAVWQRRWLLAALDLLVIACHLAWVVPDFRSATPYPEQCAMSETSRPIRIFCANIQATNPEPESVLNEIASVDPDVVVLIEYRRWWTHLLQESPVLKPYIYGTNLNQPYDGEIALFSRLPIMNQQMIWVDTPRVNDIVDIPLGNTSLRLFALHSPRPFYERHFNYGGFWRQLIPLISRQPRPLVVLGDFNATQYSLVYHEITSLGLRSAHEDRGRGFATTWPNGENPLPPIRIDQAFLSPEVECLDIFEGIGRGSDHKPLILDIRVHTDPATIATTGAAAEATR